jgi:hypothetical protein
MAASRGYSLGWVNYDEQYRLRKATSPSSSCGVVDMELWMLCVSTPPSGNIGFGNVERQSCNSPPIVHTSHTVNLGSTLNFRGVAIQITQFVDFSIGGCSVNLEKTANIYTDVQNAMEITQLQIVD